MTSIGNFFWKIIAWKTIAFCPIGIKIPIYQSSKKYVNRKNIRFLRSHDGKRTDRQTDGQMEKVIYIGGHTTYKNIRCSKNNLLLK